MCYLTAMRMYGQVQHTAYDALLSYGVNYKTLPEYKQMATVAERSTQLKPGPAQEYIIAFLSRLENAIKAAIRRKQAFTVVVDNTPPSPTKH